MIPNGAGVCIALEGGIDEAGARAALGASWSYTYQSTGSTPMIRARDYQPESGDGQVSGAWWQRVFAHRENPDEWTLCLNEPNFAAQDNLAAAEAARMLREDWTERIKVEDPKRRRGQPPRILPVKWVGPNVMAGLESSRRWLREYQAAGGVEPYRHGVHAYPSSGSELVAWVGEWSAFLDSLGWRNPIVVSEVGPRPGSDVSFAATVDILRAAFALSGRVKGFAWFSTRYPGDNGIWSGGDLLNAGGGLTPLGREYRRLATGVPLVKPVIDENVYFPVAGVTSGLGGLPE